MKNRAWALAVLFLLVAGAAAAAEFTADLKVAEGKVVKQGRILVNGDRYRMEMEDPRGPSIVVQVFPAENLCRVLVPRYKQYLESDLDQGIVRMFNPFVAAEAMKEYYTITQAGTEKLEGRTCIKEDFVRSGHTAMNRWVDKDLGFPLKITMVGQDDYFTTLTNVKVEKVPAGVFKIPAGYTQADWSAISDKIDQDPEMEAKQTAWEAKQPKATSLSSMLPTGGEFHALVGEGLTIKITGEGFGNDDLIWSVTAEANGVALPAREMKGSGELEFPADSGVNGVTLRCLQGDLRGEVSLTGFGQLVLATRTLQQQDSGGGIGRSLPEDLTAFRLKVKSLEEPGKSKLPVRISLTLEKSRVGSGQNESISDSLEPGQEIIHERKGPGVIAGYDLSLIGPGGRAEIELTIDYRPPDQQKPF